jgi:hypothetical protein
MRVTLITIGSIIGVYLVLWICIAKPGSFVSSNRFNKWKELMNDKSEIMNTAIFNMSMSNMSYGNTSEMIKYRVIADSNYNESKQIQLKVDNVVKEFKKDSTKQADFIKKYFPFKY